MAEDLPVLTETGGGLNVLYRGRLLYPERGPDRLASRTALACEKGPARLHLALSPLLWYGAEELLAGLGPGSAVIFVEADPRLLELARARMPVRVAEDPRCALVGSLEPSVLFPAASGLGAFRLVSVLELSGGATEVRGAARAAAAALEAEFTTAWRNRATLLSMGRLWARNIFRNLAGFEAIAPAPPPRLEGPVAVLGAGPSLEAVLPLLRRQRRRLSILACDTALPVLLRAGISPDLVVCLEGQAHNLADFTQGGRSGIPLFADLSSHPASFRALGGPVHLSLVSIVPSAFLDRIAALGLPLMPAPPLGSVGVHAVHIARRLGEGPLILAGLDFAFSPGKTHARGAPALDAELLRLSRTRRWPRQAGAGFRAGVRRAECPAAIPPRNGSPVAASDGSAFLLTDPALSGYAALLTDELRRPGPTALDLRGRGLDLGPAPADAAAVEEALATGCWGEARFDASAAGDAASSSASRPRAGRPEGQGIESAARAFLAGELASLHAMRNSLRGFAPFDRSAFSARLAASDYLLWPFPDPERAADLPQDFLNRLLVELEYWIPRIAELLD